jgi:hypothetical protein
MNANFTNRLDSFRTTLAYLAQPVNRSQWHDQAPTRFTQRVTDATAALTALADFCQQQSSVITGNAADKEREQAELEQAAHRLGNAVAECCRATSNETDAAKADFSLSRWHQMRDAVLLLNAHEVIRLAQGLLTAPAPALATSCGITPERIAATQKEAADFEALIASPQQAIAARRAYTSLLRDRFNVVEAHFTSLDNLIDQFPSAPFVEGYKASRITRDLGHSSRPSQPPAPTPSP